MPMYILIGIYLLTEGGGGVGSPQLENVPHPQGTGNDWGADKQEKKKKLLT